MTVRPGNYVARLLILHKRNGGEVLSQIVGNYLRAYLQPVIPYAFAFVGRDGCVLSVKKHPSLRPERSLTIQFWVKTHPCELPKNLKCPSYWRSQPHYLCSGDNEWATGYGVYVPRSPSVSPVRGLTHLARSHEQVRSIAGRIWCVY